MTTTNDSAVVELGRLKTFKNKLDASMRASSVNASTSPLPGDSNYEQAESLENFGVAIGNGSKAITNGCVSLGIGAISKAEDSVAIGSNSETVGARCLCVGGSSVAKGNSNTAIGNAAVSAGNSGNTVIGANAQIANGSGSVAIGAAAKVLGDVNRAVALGGESVANDDKTVSVGNDQLTRRIVNVTDPVNPTDAATKEYVDNRTIEVIDIAGKTAVTKPQLNMITLSWPRVAVFNGKAICPGTSEDFNINTGKTTGFAFLYVNRSNNPSNDDVIVGPSPAITEDFIVDEINIDATTGAITHKTGMSLFPIIATNPSFSAVSSVKAIGNQTVAIGNNSAATGTSSTAIGDGSKSLNISSMAVGSSSEAKATGSVAIGSNAHATNARSIALGMGSYTDREDQVSVGNKASGATRYISNVKDPVEDQDAATRHWVKNADRSDVIPTSLYSDTYGGSGSFKLEENKDMKWISVRGYTSWATFNEVWQKMVNLPNSTNGWWIKTDMKLLAGMTPTTNLFSPCYGLEFYSTYTMPQRTFVVTLAVGTDGYIYIGSWSNKSTWSSEPYGIYLSGQRFYL